MLLCSDAQAVPQSRLMGFGWNLSIRAFGASWVIFMCSHVSDASRFRWDSPAPAAWRCDVEMTSGGRLVYSASRKISGSDVYVLSGEVQTPVSQGDPLWEGGPAAGFCQFFCFVSWCSWPVSYLRIESLTREAPANSRASQSFLLYFSGAMGVTGSRDGISQLSWLTILAWIGAIWRLTNRQYQQLLGVHWKSRIPASTLDLPSQNQHLNEMPEDLLAQSGLRSTAWYSVSDAQYFN